MSYIRQPLLKPEIEAQLKTAMLPLWLSGKKGRQIAKELHLGEPKIEVDGAIKPNPYAKVKPEYIYFYRQKFKFPIRMEPRFKKGTDNSSRYNYQPEDLGTMTPEEFIQTLNAKLPIPPRNNFYIKRARTYLIVHFWTPLRESEIFERVCVENEKGKDFTITPLAVTIHLLRKKKGHLPADKKEPIDIPRVFPLMNEVVEWLEERKWDRPSNPDKRPWNISHDTAYSYVKAVFENHYPHFWRFNFITSAADDPETTLAELKAKTKLTLAALDKYVMAAKKLQKKLDDRKIEKLKASGLIK